MVAGVAQATTAPARFLALGDSYTIGESVAPEARWPLQLAAALRQRGVVIDDPTIIARTGWTTDELAAAIDQAQLTPTFDLVSLLIGVNDQYRGRALEEYRRRFEDLLARAIELVGHRPRRVLVLSIPDWGVTPFAAQSKRDTAAIAAEIDAHNAAAAAACAAHGVAFLDITGISREPATAVMLTDDGLHPSAAQYSSWVVRTIPLAQELLASP